MSVYDQARRLQRKLKDSKEYQNYQELREKVMEKSGSKKMLLDYQNLMIKLQNKRIAGEELAEGDKEKLQNLQNLIEINNSVKKYLEAEYQLSKMINDIQKIVFSELDIGISEEELESETEEEKAEK
ncbi:YlbF family regulator [Halanaerobium sp. Z-7514]|uniref:YlbF family regulator n=1 Tax=Halanaerobium polyolivorans TaxID=2886943 RepID=A0AAW4X223_9FIRM|nr:YlbF family regulator [Halanaerobium polyolivorans]MCC3145897.1 YlbF family regulator [Halanaerobium polyolivorans]